MKPGVGAVRRSGAGVRRVKEFAGVDFIGMKPIIQLEQIFQKRESHKRGIPKRAPNNVCVPFKSVGKALQRWHGKAGRRKGASRGRDSRELIGGYYGKAMGCSFIKQKMHDRKVPFFENRRCKTPGRRRGAPRGRDSRELFGKRTGKIREKQRM